MLDRDVRIAILELTRRGRGTRRIAKELGLSRTSVQQVVKSGQSERPEFVRAELLDAHLDRVRELFEDCDGNLVRVHEELVAGGVEVAYATVTGFCRRHRIGVKEKVPAGRYTFEPGEEMQHDTSPHVVQIGDRSRLLQCASVVLAHSRMVYAQLYPTFDRFYAKTFLTNAVRFFGGACRRCMVDNTNVVVAHGTGKRAVIAPEMEAFGGRFGFVFVAHEKGDANRSAHVERQFDHIENNFYAGRSFADLADGNAQLHAWCEKVNRAQKRSLHAAPVEVFAAERPHLAPLPDWIPEVVRVASRRVDVEGYISLHHNTYPVPVELIDEQVEVQETIDRVRVLHRHKVVADYPAIEPGRRERAKLLEPRVRRSATRKADPVAPEESALIAAGPEFVAMIELLRRTQKGRARVPIRRLHRLFLDYPTETLRAALVSAVAHGLHDLSGIERMVLRGLAGELFRLPIPPEDS
ncbi:MAG: IS21 family transposase [bacterium]|nr:IS21 family transposase [bacterium]